MNAFSQAAVTFTSQNMGARKYQNLEPCCLNCLLCAMVTGVCFGRRCGDWQVASCCTSTPRIAAVIAAGYERLRVICGTYLLCGIMDHAGQQPARPRLQRAAHGGEPVGSCLLRLVWIATIFQLNRTPFMLYISYPISWVLTAAVHLDLPAGGAAQDEKQAETSID